MVALKLPSFLGGLHVLLFHASQVRMTQANRSLKHTQRLLVTCIASNWPLATVFWGTRLGGTLFNGSGPLFHGSGPTFYGSGPNFTFFVVPGTSANMAGNQAGFAHAGNWKHWDKLSHSSTSVYVGDSIQAPKAKRHGTNTQSEPKPQTSMRTHARRYFQPGRELLAPSSSKAWEPACRTRKSWSRADPNAPRDPGAALRSEGFLSETHPSIN